MQKRCECGCGQVFEAERRSARYASATCRQRANRAQKQDTPAHLGAVVSFPAPKASAAAKEPPATVLEAVESGDELATLRTLLARISKAIDDPNCPPRDLAALQRGVRELSKEIRALELAERQEVSEEAPGDARFDTASV